MASSPVISESDETVDVFEVVDPRELFESEDEDIEESDVEVDDAVEFDEEPPRCDSVAGMFT
jgi:hypothetical protein